MSSRMERYNNNKSTVTGRSSKNKDLYKQIENLDTYTNIEGIASIEKTNEIDISKVKEMLKSRENYKKQKQINSFSNVSEPQEEKKVEIKREEKNYDINDILSRVKKDESKEQDNYRKLNQTQYDILKSLKLEQKKEEKKDSFKAEDAETELKELINTITSTKALNDLSLSEDVGLLDDLKSDTMVGNASSIKKIIDEEKDKKPIDFNEEKEEIDKSFYTSSFGFTSSDFEELKNMNRNLKKNNKLVIILLSILILVALIIGFYFILK